MIKKYIFFLFLLVSNTILSQINFQDEALALGVNVSSGTPFLGSGVSLVDFDKDGWDDITLATGAGQNIRFFKNVNGTFVEQVFSTINLNYRTKSISWVDIDNDGDKDLFVTSDTDGNKLFENTGSLTFVDITASSGISTANMFSYGATWGDIDNDGFLDVFINNRSETISNKLYKNNGNNTFVDVSATAGISSSAYMSFCAAFFDFNNDGWQDIYISNDKYNNANIMYKNNGDGTFVDESEYSGTNISIDAMTTTIGDYNNDGWFDIYVTNTTAGNVLFRNEGDGTFANATEGSGTSYNSIGWGTVFLDAENDKDIDMYVSGSLDGTVPSFVSAAFYENIGTGIFQAPANAGFLGDNSESYSNAVSDINKDGLIDIVVNNGGDDNVFIWKNLSITTNNWLKVSLEGVQSNIDGIGSVIEISINGNKQYRYTHSGEGYMSQNSTTESFGLGNDTTIDYVKVTWLSGVVDIINNVSANQTIHIVENSTLSNNDFQINKVSLQSNPVNDVIVVNSKLPVYKLELYSMLGQSVLVQENSRKMEVSQLNAGHYLLYVSTAQGTSVLKWIKQ
ncbi:FG-GAP-like repeat-containing protein [Lacinutrix cladophorae]